MPTFRFEHDDGRTYRIEASDAEAAQRVLSEAGLLEAAAEGTSGAQRGTAADVGVGALRGLVAGVPDAFTSLTSSAMNLGQRALLGHEISPVEDPRPGSRIASGLGIPDPQTSAGRIAEEAGRGVAVTGATLPLGGAGAASRIPVLAGRARSLTGLLAGGATSGAASQAGREAGLPEPANLALGMVTPSLPGMARRSVGRAGKAMAGGPVSVAGRRRSVGEDLAEAFPTKERALQSLRRASDDFDAGLRPDQVLDSQKLKQAARDFAGEFQPFGTMARDQADEVIASALAEVRKVTTARGVASRIPQNLAGNLSKARNSYHRLYDSVTDVAVETAPVRAAVARVRRSSAGARSLRSALPDDVIADVEALSTSASLSSIEPVRRGISRALAKAKVAGDREQVRNLRIIKSGIDRAYKKTEKRVPGSSREAQSLRNLRRAQRLRAQFGDAFERSEVAKAFGTRAFEEIAEEGVPTARAIERVLRSRNPVKESGILRTLTRGSNQAEDDLASAIGELVFEKAATKAKPLGNLNAARDFVRKNRRPLSRMLGGDEAVEAMEKNLRIARKAYDDIGRSAEAFRTRSGQAGMDEFSRTLVQGFQGGRGARPLEFLMATGGAAAGGPVGAAAGLFGAAGLSKAQRWLIGQNDNLTASLKGAALRDGKLMRQLIEEVPDEAFASWRVRMTQSMKRTGIISSQAELRAIEEIERSSRTR